MLRLTKRKKSRKLWLIMLIMTLKTLLSLRLTNLKRQSNQPRKKSLRGAEQYLNPKLKMTSLQLRMLDKVQNSWLSNHGLVRSGNLLATLNPELIRKCHQFVKWKLNGSMVIEAEIRETILDTQLMEALRIMRQLLVLYIIQSSTVNVSLTCTLMMSQQSLSHQIKD